jgi:hypothetical protein
MAISLNVLALLVARALPNLARREEVQGRLLPLQRVMIMTVTAPRGSGSGDEDDDNEVMAEPEFVFIQDTEDEAQDFDKKQIREWKRSYQDNQRPQYVQYLLGTLNDASSKRMKPFIDSLADIGRAKDNLTRVQKLHGKLYRWRIYFAKRTVPVHGWTNKAPLYPEKISSATGTLPEPDGDLEQAKELTDSEPFTWPPAGQRYVLELLTKEGKWKSWLSLRRSTFRESKVGLFTERSFAANSPLGFLIGRTKWQSKLEGGTKPCTSLLAAQGVKMAESDELYRDWNAAWRLVELEPLGCKPSDPARHLYMGMQYLNAPATFPSVSVPAAASASSVGAPQKYGRVVFCEDGVVKLAQQVDAGAELFVGEEVDLLENTYTGKEKKKNKKSSPKKAASKGSEDINVKPAAKKSGKVIPKKAGPKGSEDMNMKPAAKKSGEAIPNARMKEKHGAKEKGSGIKRKVPHHDGSADTLKPPPKKVKKSGEAQVAKVSKKAPPSAGSRKDND